MDNIMDSNLPKELEIIKSAFSKRGISDNKNFHIGEFVEIPEQCGCFKRNGKWYTYHTDEKNFCTFQGPYDLHGIIYACAMELHVSKYFKEYKFSEEETKIYLHNFFHKFAEIDENEQKIK